jgi:hypothetical protein
MKPIIKFSTILSLALTCFVCPAQNPLPRLEKFHRFASVGDSIAHPGGLPNNIEA